MIYDRKALPLVFYERDGHVWLVCMYAKDNSEDTEACEIIGKMHGGQDWINAKTVDKAIQHYFDRHRGQRNGEETPKN